MNGRFFGGRQVNAFLADGKLKYRKSGQTNEDADEKKRLDGFANWLEGEQQQ